MIQDRNFYKTLFRISLPTAFSSLVSFLVVVADDIMVSSISSETAESFGKLAQAAVSQVNAITAFFTATLLGLASGSGVLISQYWGKKDEPRIKTLFSMVFWIALLTTVFFVLAAKIFPEQILSLLLRGNGEETAQTLALAKRYFAIVCFSYLPYAVTGALTGMLRAIEVVKVALYVSIASLFLNIGLNYVLIFGKLGFPPMGVEGAALATVLARCVEMCIVLFYTFKVQKSLSLRGKDFFRFDKNLFLDYQKYGLPVAVTDCQWSFIGLLKAAILGKLSAAFLSANAITTAMMNLGTMFTFALAGGACVMVGKAVGSGDEAKAREESKTIQILFACIGVLMAAVVFLLRKPFVSLYGSSSDADVFRLSTKMIAIGAVTLMGTSYHAACFIGINRGAGDSRFVACVDMICGWLIVLPSMLLAVYFRLPLEIIFLSTRIDQCFKWIIAFTRLRGNKWMKNLTR